MNARSAQDFPLTRVVSVGVVALVIAGMSYLGVASGTRALSVPAGARAGQLTDQRPCAFTTEKGSEPADCGTLVVPENWADPRSRLIALPVIRVRARSGHQATSTHAEPVFYLEGGPGLTNVRFAQADRYVGDRDMVMVGYRGVDGSVRLDCPEVANALEHSPDMISQASFRAYGDAYRSCAARLTKAGVDLAGYGLPQQVNDLEAARKALGYQRIDLLSQSAGTRTALIYAWQHPDVIHRSVMIAANPPGHFLWNTRVIDQLIGRYAALCAKDSNCRARTPDLTATMHRTTAIMPHRWMFLPIKKGDVRLASFYGLMESTPTAGLMSGPATIDAWLAAAHGDPSGLWLDALLGHVVMPRSFVWGEYAAAGMLDAQAARNYFASPTLDRSSLGYAGSAVTWGGGRLADAWPNSPYTHAYAKMRASRVETLVISGALDFAAPPQGATRELMPYLPNGHQVVLPNVGHVASFFAEQPDAGSHLINTFYRTGRTDTSLYRPQTLDFTPATKAPATAKKLVGLMVGLSLLTLLSLVWMGYRVRTRGRLAPVTSAVVRCGFALVLGLGGWFLGILLVLATNSALPITDPYLAVTAIAIPVACGVWLAWAKRALPSKVNLIGLASSAMGALLGAWLGFQVTSGFLVVATTIVAAVVGANLPLLAFDIARDRQRHGRTKPATTSPVPKATATTKSTR